MADRHTDGCSSQFALGRECEAGTGLLRIGPALAIAILVCVIARRPPRRRWRPAPVDLVRRLRAERSKRKEHGTAPEPPWREPPDDAMVVRGGTLEIGDLANAAVKATVRLGRPGISVAAGPGGSQRELLALSGLPHPKVSFSQVGRIRAAGFEMEQTGPWPHHTVWLPENWETSGALQRLKDAFDAPVERKEL